MGILEKFFGGNNNNNTNEVTVSMDALSSSFVRGNSYAKQGDSNALTLPNVDEDTALKIGALYQGINIIGDTIATLPCYLYRETDGYNEILDSDPRSRILSGMANETLSSFNLKKSLIKDVILKGNGYAKIERSGKDTFLRYMPVGIVTPKRDSSGYYFEVQSYSTEVSGERYEAEIVDFEDMVVLTRGNKYNSIQGMGILDYANDIFATSTEETKYMYGLLANGLSAKAILASKTPFSKGIKERLKNDLRDLYSGANNAGKVMVLEGDVNVIPLSLTPTDLRLIENKQFTISEISRFLNIPKHLLNLDRQQGTYSNITQERLQLLTNTLMPYVTMIEQAMNQKILTPQEIEQGYYFAFDTSELMKMTPEDQSDYMIKLLNANVVTVEEVRATLGLGGDLDTINQLKDLHQSKMSAIVDGNNTDKKEKSEESVKKDSDDVNKKEPKQDKEV